MNKKSSGQSIIEAVFLIGALALVLSGAAVLLLNTVNNRTKGFDRKKASELAQVILEEQVARKINDPTTFWASTASPSLDQTRADFEGYTYDLTFQNVACTVSTQCAEATVVVKWQRDTSLSITFNRLFSR